MLLNLLVRYLSEDEDERGGGGAVEVASLGRKLEWRRVKGYVFALLLGLAAILKVGNPATQS